jgi:ankyrin repeat protein
MPAWFGVEVKRIVYFSTAIFLVAAASLFLVLSKMRPESLIICASDSGGSLIPSPLCRYYFLNFTTAADAKDIDARSGLSFAFEISDRGVRDTVIDRLLFLGADVNAPSKVDGLTPINAAILLNDPSLVGFLLSKGASLGGSGLPGSVAPRQFLKLLKEKDKAKERRAVELVLDAAVK